MDERIVVDVSRAKCGELSVDRLRGKIPAGYPLVHKLARVK